MFDDRTAVLEAVRTSFGRPRVLVVGDLMLDRYLWGEVKRISAEAPIPVVRVLRESAVAGGAGNVAHNLSRLGLSVTLAGFIGEDSEGNWLRTLLHDQGIDTSPLKTLADRPTITKTRVMGGNQQALRIDKEDLTSVAHHHEAALLEGITAHLADVSAVVLSDYAKGTLSERVCQGVISRARSLDIPVYVDPKQRDFGRYAGATTLTPNLAELAAATGVSSDDQAALLTAGGVLAERLGLESLVVTRSEEGLSLLGADGISHFPALAREVYDVSGAGDTVIATVVAGQLAGLGYADTLRLANVAAGVVVGKLGTAPVSQAELLESLHLEHYTEQLTKVMTLKDLLPRVAAWHARGERVVFTNGCFDLLHVGHVTYLEGARREGDRLVVGLNTDRSVRALKGEGRPVVLEDDRARVLAALSSVDAVVLFDEDTPLALINAIKPDVLAKGSDYTEAQVVGAAEVKAWGGRVALVPLVGGRSTTALIRKLERSDIAP